jgi:uncharacterized protein YqhQ
MSIPARLRLFLKVARHVQLLPVLESGEETTLIGGQAVMEGVMMRAPHSYCVAVRRPDGEIRYETRAIAKPSDKNSIWKLPLLRGLATLGQALKLGMESLQFSANVALEADAEKEAIAKGEDPAKRKAAESKPISNAMMGVQLAISLGFFIVMYKFVPLWLATQAQKAAPVLENRYLFNLTDGLIRIAIFLAFMYGMSLFKDIRRVFEFHGAEHRTVFNFESGQPITVENAQRFVTWHPRCGTSFLIMVMIISMCVYTVLPFQDFWGRLASRVVAIPFIAGLSYEVIRYAAKRPGSLFTLMTRPGLWLQRITTKTPTNDQTDVAVKALEGAMALEKEQGGQMVIA